MLRYVTNGLITLTVSRDQTNPLFDSGELPWSWGSAMDRRLGGLAIEHHSNSRTCITHSFRDHFVLPPANERRRFIVTSSLIGRAFAQTDPCHSLFEGVLVWADYIPDRTKFERGLE